MATKQKQKVQRLSSSSSNWACLPSDLLDSIIERLTPLVDYLRFGAVCKSWNSTALNHKEKRIRQHKHRLPFMLMITNQNGFRNLYNFSSAEPCNSKLRISYKYARKLFSASSQGWLLYFHPVKCQLAVYNPLHGTVISLPPMRFKRYSWVEAVLSIDPYLGSFEVLAFNFQEVAHLKFGDEVWTYSSTGSRYMFSSITFYKDRMLGVTMEGDVLSINVMSDAQSSPDLHIAVVAQELFKGFEYLFLVESTKGDLLVVLRAFCPHLKHAAYKIFKMIESDGKLEKVLVEDLGGDSLFLGRNNSTSVLASDYPGCRPNSIYLFCTCSNGVEE